jgi:glycosyltransferase involved in cell wall biosynthesis
MKILYDHQIFSSQAFGGISRYFYELLSRFSADAEIEFELALRYSRNSYLAGADFVAVSSFFGDRRFFGKTTLLNLINGLYSKRGVRRGDFDVFHPTYYNPYFLPHLRRKPFVVTVYDMVHELYPEMFAADDPTREWKREVLRNASRVIAISESTKSDLLRFYGVDEAVVKVVHLAGSLGVTTAARPVAGLPDRYLLFVGQRRGYKNFAPFARAVTPLLKGDSGLTVVCAGGGGFSPDERALFDGLGIAGRICQVSVDDDHLVALYRNARAFVYPSLYEGFGIPVLEALACGCPTVVSDSSSLPEVGGDAALYFDPHDELSMRDAISRAISDASLRGEFRERGFARARQFSWDKTARETKAVYEGLL